MPPLTSAPPVAVVWKALTDYDGLGTFIPGATQFAPCATGCTAFDRLSPVALSCCAS